MKTLLTAWKASDSFLDKWEPVIIFAACYYLALYKFDFGWFMGIFVAAAGHSLFNLIARGKA